MANLRTFLGGVILHFSSVGSVWGFAMLRGEVARAVSKCTNAVKAASLPAAAESSDWCRAAVEESCAFCHKEVRPDQEAVGNKICASDVSTKDASSPHKMLEGKFRGED